MNTIQALFIGGWFDGRREDIRYSPQIEFAIPKALSVQIEEDDMYKTPDVERVTYKVAAISVDERQAIYTISGTLDEMFSSRGYIDSIMKDRINPLS